MKVAHRIISTVLTKVFQILELRNRVKSVFDFAAVLLAFLFMHCRFCGQRKGDKKGGGTECLVRLSISLLVVALCLFVIRKILLLRERSPRTRNDSTNNFYERRKYSPRTIQSDSLHYINGGWFTVNDNCRYRFRGVNLPAKTPSHPANLKNTKSLDNFFESKHTVSFVDRPFPLKDALQHFERLSNFGYNLIRLAVTWEAVMHEGPGLIDETYLEYLNKLVDIAHEFGLYILIDPHQDVWSRFTGGDGAPAWTLDVVGFKTDETLHDTGCAVLHQCLKGEDTPRMVWPTNYWKLVTATMFTLFFAGDEYANGQNVSGTDESLQHFLQRQYLSYLDAVAASLKNKKNVIGFGTMNEPNAGFVGVPDLNESHAPVPYGNVLSGFDSIRLGSGETIHSEYYPAPFVYHHTDVLNSRNKSVWKASDLDVWRRAGIYDVDEEGKRVLLRPHHFALKDDDFMSKFMKPFYSSVHKTITKHNANFVTFAEPHLESTNPFVEAPDDLDRNNFAWSPHFYDFLMLVMKAFISWMVIDIDSELPVFTPHLIDRVFQNNLRRFKESGKNMHVLLGETGIPFDMGSQTDYNAALNRILKAVEANDLDYTLWCYYPTNTDQDGDEWNGENLSITTKDGNRGILSAVRPFAFKYSPMVSISQRFDPFIQKYELELNLDHCPENDRVALDIFVPSCHFNPPTISVSSGSFEYNETTQTLRWEMSPQILILKMQRLEIVK